jgi:hypothetical protein
MPLTTGTYLIGTHCYFARSGDTIASTIGTSSRARNTNVATIITPTPHGLFNGASVTISGLGGAGYNIGPVAVTVVDGTTFTYPCVAANEAVTADTAGTVTQAGTASSTNRPGPNDVIWNELGVIDSASVSLDGTDIEVYGPSPGKLTLHSLFTTKRKLTLKFTSQEWSPLAAEVLYLTEKLTSSSTQFNPLEGDDKLGWLKTERFDSNDTLLEVLDTWGRLRISGEVSFGGDEVAKPGFEFLVLHSSLNSGAL